MDDLKKYEVPINKIPIWYHETIREFIVYYCEDMDWRNKILLLELLSKAEPKPETDSKLVNFMRKTV